MGKNTKGGKKQKKQKNKTKSGIEKKSSSISRPVSDDQCIGHIISALGSKRFMVLIKGKEYNCRLRGSRQLKGMSAYAKSGFYCLCSHRGYENVYDILTVYHSWEKDELKKEGLIPKEENIIEESIIFENTNLGKDSEKKEEIKIPDQKKPSNDDDISSDDDEECMRQAILIYQKNLKINNEIMK